MTTERLDEIDKSIRNGRIEWKNIYWMVEEIDRLRAAVAIMDDMATQKNDLVRENERLKGLVNELRWELGKEMLAGDLPMQSRPEVEAENERLRKEIEEAVEMFGEIVAECKCRCDPCWTDRRLHAPDCYGHLVIDTAGWLERNRKEAS